MMQPYPYFTHTAEKLSDENGTVTIVRVKGADCLYEWNGDGTMRGWLYDGESENDIRWEWEGVDGWPEHLSD